MTIATQQLHDLLVQFPAAQVAKQHRKTPKIADYIERCHPPSLAEVAVCGETLPPIAAGETTPDRFARGASLNQREGDSVGEDGVVEWMGISEAQPTVTDEWVRPVRIV